MVYEIHQKKDGTPYLKKVDRKRYSGEPRGMWVDIGRVDSPRIDEVIRRNEAMGYLVLEDEDGWFRTLVLTD